MNILQLDLWLFQVANSEEVGNLEKSIHMLSLNEKVTRQTAEDFSNYTENTLLQSAALNLCGKCSRNLLFFMAEELLEGLC